MKNTLILFTKYPKENEVKTRLIPSIGAKKATKLHKILTENTLNTLKKYSYNGNTKRADIIIFYKGSSEEDMIKWLGDEFQYFLQKGNDLGEIMKNAFYSVFQNNFSKAIIVGSDCPNLSVEIINEAFNNLDSYDIVLGKALDGGYYLIGKKELIPEVFDNIPWSTENVLTETLKVCEKLNKTYYLAQTLSDCDTIHDLEKFPELLKIL